MANIRNADQWLSLADAERLFSQFPEHGRRKWSRLLDLFEEGSAVTEVASAPPLTDIDVLNRASKPTADWWREYLRSDPPRRDDWNLWFRDGGMLIPAAAAWSIIRTVKGELHAFFSVHERIRPARSWNLVEAWCWVATRDDNLVALVRKFGSAAPHQQEAALHLQYATLRSHVAHDHCRCGKLASPFEGAMEFEKCTCLVIAWDALVEKLMDGKLLVTVPDAESGEPRKLAPATFRHAQYSQVRAGFSLISSPRDPLLRFDEVQLKHVFREGPFVRTAAPNRQLDHEQIIEQAQQLKEKKPGITIGSAALSIVHDLPRKNGKLRDARHVEKIIAPLWKGQTQKPSEKP